MAPESFPLIASHMAFVALCASVLLAIVVSTGLLIWARYDRRRRKPLCISSACSFCGALLLCGPLLLVGHYIRQVYFLNEPLVSVCCLGDVPQAQRLLQRGASPDAEDCDGMQSALMAAAVSGHRDIVAMLLG